MGVLLVEDEAQLREMLAGDLADAGLDVAGAPSADAALASEDAATQARTDERRLRRGQTLARPPLAWNSDTMRAASVSFGFPPAVRATSLCAATWMRAPRLGPLRGGTAGRVRLVRFSVVVNFHAETVGTMAGGAAIAPSMDAPPQASRRLAAASLPRSVTTS